MGTAECVVTGVTRSVVVRGWFAGGETTCYDAVSSYRLTSYLQENRYLCRWQGSTVPVLLLSGTGHLSRAANAAPQTFRGQKDSSPNSLAKA